MRRGKKEPKTPEDALSYEIIGTAIEVHKVLGGPGLLESIYEEAMVWELQSRGISVERQVEVPIYFGEQYVKNGVHRVANNL